MTAQPKITRWQEIVLIWQKEQWLYGLVGAFTGFIFGIAVSGKLGQVVIWFANGFWNEALSIAITVIVLDRLNRLRTKDEHRLNLFRQVRSRSNSAAVEALDQIQHENWWNDLLEHYRTSEGYVNLRGIQWNGGVRLNGFDFQKADLRGANLQQANLTKANLQQTLLHRTNLQSVYLLEANLQEANLEEADLSNTVLNEANLQKARLFKANLQEANFQLANMQETNLRLSKMQNADFSYCKMQNADLSLCKAQNANFDTTNLQGASLGLSDFEGANLRYSNLRQANLLSANLTNAKLSGARFDEKTVLPDAQNLTDEQGKMVKDKQGNYVYTKASYWTPDIDMSRYTNPEHPDFWDWNDFSKKRQRKQDNI